ncbi:glycosyltransferase family A protein [Patiriisocius marinus]|uniref:glycosyltransferase family A protein n=1 Tax=Patiriisocius marinus TaxID=1397112 RepID=UPI00232C07DB|nr:glycosyltransferase family A protein [Patiriisocius marinus]
MRVGENPAKKSNAINVLKKHRIIMVFYVPDTADDYFSQLEQVLEISLKSLLATINITTTAITLINNSGSNKSLDVVVEKYKDQIDKYISYSENKGKVYAVINEVRGVFEEFVTITDSDILFFDGWEKKVFEVFKNFPKAGVVSPYPSPYTSFHFNQSVFGLNTILGKVTTGKIVDDADVELYKLGTNLPDIDKRKGKFSWKERQYALENGKHQAIIGAYHVVSTYRTEQFKTDTSFPEVKFKNSYESFFIDCLADRYGLFRLSTTKSYMYHMGNKLDDFTNTFKHTGEDVLCKDIFNTIKQFRRVSPILVSLNRILGRIFIKYKWNRN